MKPTANGHAPATPILTLAQRIAMATCMQRFVQAKQEMDALMVEIGLDPKKVYEMTPEGIVKERA